MWRAVLDLSFGYAMYKVIKFFALNLYLLAIKYGVKRAYKKVNLDDLN